MKTNKSIYESPSVLGRLHDHKAGYQRNMIRANCLVGLAFLCIFCGGLILKAVDNVNGSARLNAVLLADISGSVTAPEESLTTRGSNQPSQNWGPIQPQLLGYGHAGWIDANRLVIVPDNVSMQIRKGAYRVQVDDPGPELLFSVTEPLESDLGYGGYDDLGLPPEKTFFDMRIPGKRLPDFVYIPNTATGQMSRDHGISINRNDVRNHTPLFPVRALKSSIDSAVVKLAVTIDENGNIKKLRLLEEDPKGYGFAEALQETHVINRWRIAAPCRNGQSFGCTFPLTYVFCRNCPVEVHIETPAFALTTSPSSR